MRQLYLTSLSELTSGESIMATYRLCALVVALPLALIGCAPTPDGSAADTGSPTLEVVTQAPMTASDAQPREVPQDRGPHELHFSGLRCEDHLPYGAPAELAVPVGDRVTVCQLSGDSQQAFFVSRFDRTRVSTDWTAYTLTREMMLAVARSEIVRREHGLDFQSDPQIEAEHFRSPGHLNFTGIGNLSPAHDRGHLAPAEPFKWSLEGYQRTFIVSNIAIQAGWFNQQLWQDVEAQVQGWACDLGTVHIVTGVVHGQEPALFELRQREDTSHIPAYFYVAAYTPQDGGHAVAIIFPNTVPLVAERDITPEAGAVSIAELEARTGLDFHPVMEPDQQTAIEAVAPAESIWRFDYPRNFQCRN